MSSRSLRRFLPSGQLATALGVFAIGLVVVGLIALLQWARSGESEADRGLAPQVDAGPPSAHAAAIDVAREFTRHMLARQFLEAVVFVDGPAAEQVKAELEARMQQQAYKDPQLTQILDKAFSAELLGFDPGRVEPSDGGRAVTVRAALKVRSGLDGKERTLHPVYKMRHDKGRWVVREYLPDLPE
jgi:hypothetical protein